MEDQSQIEVWDTSDDKEDCTGGCYSVSSSVLRLLRFVVIFLLSWQVIFCIPNSALDILFKFFCIFLRKLSEFSDDKVKELSQAFPESLLMAQKMQCIFHDKYQKMVVCPKCYSTYEYSDCFSAGNAITSCSFIRFPRHPQARMKIPCGAAIIKTIKTSSGKNIQRPIKIYCYQNLIECIKMFFAS